MSKSNADRQKEYRDRKRNAQVRAPVTTVTLSEIDVTAGGDNSVTQPADCNAPSVTKRETGHPVDNICVEMVAKPTFADLPADVQYQIEKHCSENNNGARASSHSRASMTERALAYQAKMGKRPGTGLSIDPRLAKIYDDSAAAVGLSGPLSVYSADRWAYLQSRGYQWDQDINRALTSNSQGTLIAVPVPGDPAYGPTGDNVCSECGKPTGHKLVVKCGACSWSKTG